MPIDPSLLKQKQELLEDIVSYMKYGGADDETDEEYDPDFDAGYTQEHVNECDAILSEFLASVQAHAGGKSSLIMDDVKTAVLALNALNEKCGHAMIETDQREEICALIDNAVSRAGLDPEGDVTEQWREW